MTDYGSLMESEAAAAPGSYLGTMQRELTQDTARLRASAMQAEGSNPDEMAQHRQTASYLGVLPAVVAASPADAQRQASMKHLEEQTANAPTLRGRYMDPEFMKLAHDDVGVLSQIERTVRDLFTKPGRKLDHVDPVLSSVQFSDTVQRMVQRNPALDYETARSLALQGTQIENGPIVSKTEPPKPTVSSIARGLFGLESWRAQSAGMSVMASDALGFLQTENGQSLPGSALRQYEVAKARAERFEPKFETSTGQGIYSGLRSLVNNAPGLIMSVLTGNPAPALTLAGPQAGTDAHLKCRERSARPCPELT